MHHFLNNLPRTVRRSAFSLLVALVTLGSFSLSSCKKQPSASELAAQDQLAKVKAELRELLTSTTMTLEEKEQALARIKSMNLTDPEVISLIAQVEEKLAQERAEKERLMEEERLRAEEAARRQAEANSPQNKLQNFFGQIANAGNSGNADMAINQALGLFASPDAPVLIIISKMADGTPDYDRPTTIQKYLNYLKDQKKEAEAIENIVFDDNGKIKELELTKLK